MNQRTSVQVNERYVTLRGPHRGEVVTVVLASQNKVVFKPASGPRKVVGERRHGVTRERFLAQHAPYRQNS